jgi:zinc/manganese transport system substrate-binding protein
MPMEGVLRWLPASLLALWATSAVAATIAMAATGAVAATGLAIVAAENVYGDVARQLAGPDAVVVSILNNPDQDPHLFEASPSVARALSGARIVVYNGADYDPWMPKLLAAARAQARQAIVVAELTHKQAGDNPHLWYDVEAVAATAQALAAALQTADPRHAPDYAARLAAFTASLQPLRARISALREKYRGVPVSATEPVFGYMASALGLQMRNERFQMAVMNDTEPAASDIAAFEGDLRGHRVRLLLFNSQAANGAAKRLLRIATEANVPVVGVTETEPADTTYQEWMARELDAVGAALARPGR